MRIAWFVPMGCPAIICLEWKGRRTIRRSLDADGEDGRFLGVDSYFFEVEQRASPHCRSRLVGHSHRQLHGDLLLRSCCAAGLALSAWGNVSLAAWERGKGRMR
ncbi:MAG: hypothetical protein HG464_005075 [Bacteroidia bacterium]|jgi:hypothetical protein|nr:hypothetical protein [Bacteroidia bacterium]